MRTRNTKLAVACLVASSLTGCAQLPSIQTAPINQFARFLGVGWSDGYHECDPRYCRGPGPLSGMNCTSCGSVGCSSCQETGCYQVQQFAPNTSSVQSPTPTPLQSDPNATIQPNMVPSHSFAPPAPSYLPNTMSPLLPEALPTQSKPKLPEKSLMKTGPELVEAEEADGPPSPSDRNRKNRPQGSVEELRQPSNGGSKTDSLLKPEQPKPSTPQPKVEEDDLLSYQRREPTNMVYTNQQPARFVPSNVVSNSGNLLFSPGMNGMNSANNYPPSMSNYPPSLSNYQQTTNFAANQSMVATSMVPSNMVPSNMVPPSMFPSNGVQVIPNPYVPQMSNLQNGPNRYQQFR